MNHSRKNKWSWNQKVDIEWWPCISHSKKRKPENVSLQRRRRRRKSLRWKLSKHKGCDLDSRWSHTAASAVKMLKVIKRQTEDTKQSWFFERKSYLLRCWGGMKENWDGKQHHGSLLCVEQGCASRCVPAGWGKGSPCRFPTACRDVAKQMSPRGWGVALSAKSLCVILTGGKSTLNKRRIILFSDLKACPVSMTVSWFLGVHEEPCWDDRKRGL